MTSFSYLSNKPSTETRVHIYEYAFGPATHAKRLSEPISGGNPQEQKDERLVLFKPADVVIKRFETSFFCTNKTISSEAMDTFFNSKIVRLSFEQL